MNETDLEIAKIVTNDARISFRKIAAQLEISTKQVIKRYNKLRKNVMPHSTITLDLEKLGFVGHAVFLIKITYKNELEKIFEQITRIKNVIVVLKFFGTFEFMVVVPFENFEQMWKLNEEISTIEGIKEVELLFDETFHSWPLNFFSQLL